MSVVLTIVTNKNKYTENKQYKNTVHKITHITKTPTQLSKHTHITKPTHTHTPPISQCSVTSPWEPQAHNSGTVHKFDLMCLEDEKNSTDRMKSDVFHHFRFCKNESRKYLTSLICDILHLICLLHFLNILSIFIRIKNFNLYNLHICCYWLYIWQ